MRTIAASSFSIALLIASPLFAQLVLVEEGGSMDADNLALGPDTYSFAIDSLAGFPIHDISHLNDGIYGNSNSWIGNSGSPGFAGVNLGGKFTIRSIAFGRDNTGAYSDRCLGRYTLQVTTVEGANEFTPDADWVTVGSVENGPFCPRFPALRHRYNFPPVEATAVRLIVPGTGMALGTCIDELEVYEDEGQVLTDPCPPPAEELELLKVGGPGHTTPAERADEVSTLEEGNIARAPDAIPFGTPPHPLPKHQIPGINDGLYGNDHSWLGNEPGPASGKVYGGVYFTGGLKEIEEIALGRDNLGQYADRAEGPYIIQYTQDEFDPTDDASTDAAKWITLGQASAHLTDGKRALRHVYGFQKVQARAVRVITLVGNCFDEIELGGKLSKIDRGAPPEIPNLILAEEGGTMDEDNLAMGPGAYSFAIDSLEGFPIHDVSHLNDGIYGNQNSWIGNSGAPGFAGINLGGKFVIRSIAFGRDNTGTYSDRCLGRYILQVTTAPDPNEFTPNSAWVTVGKVVNDEFCPPVPYIRHRYNFDPVEATGVRLLVPGTGMAFGTCIDELEVYAEPGEVTAPPCSAPEPLELVAAGGPLRTPALEDDVPSLREGNEAQSPAAVAFSTPPYPLPIHDTVNLNDGLYGNDHSWLGNEPGPASGKVYCGIYFQDGLHKLSGIALGRDNTGRYDDRAEGPYMIQYTQEEFDPSDDWSTDSARWIYLGIADAHLTDGLPGLRHAYRFSPVEARAVRVLTQLGNAIDELELLGEGGGPQRPLFHRGDPNDDGSINITDGIYVLNYLFLGGPAPSCEETADLNDDGSINITDGIYVLNYLFLGGPEPAAPGPTGRPCGPDPADSPRDLGCASYKNC